MMMKKIKNEKEQEEILPIQSKEMEKTIREMKLKRR